MIGVGFLCKNIRLLLILCDINDLEMDILKYWNVRNIKIYKNIRNIRILNRGNYKVEKLMVS